MKSQGWKDQWTSTADEKRFCIRAERKIVIKIRNTIVDKFFNHFRLMSCFDCFVTVLVIIIVRFYYFVAEGNLWFLTRILKNKNSVVLGFLLKLSLEYDCVFNEGSTKTSKLACLVHLLLEQQEIIFRMVIVALVPVTKTIFSQFVTWCFSCLQELGIRRFFYSPLLSNQC
jgi:hypothetical protein